MKWYEREYRQRVNAERAGTIGKCILIWIGVFWVWMVAGVIVLAFN